MSSIIYSRDFVITALPLTCKSFHDLSDAFYHDLEQKMVADPFVSMQHFKLVLPEECIGIEDGATTTLSTFITTNNLFGVNISESVQYKGNSKAFRELATGNVISFSEWEAFVDFMRSLYVEPKPKPPDLATITEYDQLMIPRARDEPFSYEDLKAKLSQRVMGQEEAVDTIAYQTAMALRKKDPKKPVSFICYGPPGIGKSELTKALADILSHHPDTPFSSSFVDLNSFRESFSVQNFTGPPPGYIGYGNKAIFDVVVENPYTVFIFDELDKAHPEIIKIFMAILDEGRCVSQKELPNHSHEYDFKHCIFIFTTNYDLSASTSTTKRKIGFSVECSPKNAVEVQYKNDSAQHKQTLPQRIYAETERARMALINRTGTLQEIASRFTCFVEFKPLEDSAKIRILAKQIVETGMEYGVRLTYIAPGIMQEVINAVTAENSLTVRSFKAVIEGYLAFSFAATEAVSDPDTGMEYRLDGTLRKPRLIPAKTR